MKISIITSVYNGQEHIKEAIESVLEQSYKNIEYIIIDGASTDYTIKIVNSYSTKITRFISEPDNGIYDGLNKGINLATGDIIGFLHSDDYYFNNKVIENIAKEFTNTNCDGVYGDLIYVKKKDTNRVVRYWKSEEFNHESLKRGWMPPHPTFFLKRDIYNKFGSFNTNFKIAADYDFMLKILSNKKIKVSYLEDTLYVMRVGGTSNKSLKNILHKSLEDFKALKSNKIGGILVLIRKNLSKIKQFWQYKFRNK